MRRSVRRTARNVPQRLGRTLRKARSKRTRGRKTRGRKSIGKQLTETLTLPKELSETLSSILQGPKKSVKGKRPVIQMESSSEPVKKKSKKKKTKSWHAKIHGKSKKGKKKKHKKKQKGGADIPGSMATLLVLLGLTGLYGGAIIWPNKKKGDSG